MKTAIILLVSGILIGAGISVIWRDLQGRRRRAFVSKRDAPPSAEPEAEITISYDRKAAAAPAKPLAAIATAEPSPPADASRPRPPRAIAREPEPPRQNASQHPLEQEWSKLQPILGAAIDKINAVLAPVRLTVGSTGEPSWSYKNRGYGAYRRLLLGGESVAWLRLELSPDGRLNASVRAHKEDGAEINAAVDEQAKGLSTARAGELLSRCLKPAASYAVRQQPGPDGDERASALAWRSVDSLVAAALKATNGALAQAGARLTPLAPAAWEAELRRHRMTLSVEVDGDDVARMHIERHPHEMEVAVGVREPALIDLGRRRRVPVEGMTIHALAELIASCAWPAIERTRETRRLA
jgi:hypothetical protein